MVVSTTTSGTAQDNVTEAEAGATLYVSTTASIEKVESVPAVQFTREQGNGTFYRFVMPAEDIEIAVTLQQGGGND